MTLQIVAVNDASPGACVDTGLTWNGSTTITSSRILAGTSFTASGTLAVTGAVGCAASITLGAGADLLGSSTSDITINTNKFTVAGATGNTVVAGTLAATGITTHAAGVAFGATENIATHGVVAIPITKGYQGYTTDSSSAIAATLADGAVGQRIFIILTTKDTNNMVVTPANLNGGTTLTFDATGEYAELMFVGTGWTVLTTTATLA